MSEIWEEIRNEGKMKGKLEGQTEAINAVDSKMIKDGTISFDKIAELTGLSIDKVREIAGNLSA